MRLFSEKKSSAATTPSTTAAATDKNGIMLIGVVALTGTAVGAAKGGGAEVGAGVAMLYDPDEELGVPGPTLKCIGGGVEVGEAEGWF